MRRLSLRGEEGVFGIPKERCEKVQSVLGGEFDRGRKASVGERLGAAASKNNERDRMIYCTYDAYKMYIFKLTYHEFGLIKFIKLGPLRQLDTLIRGCLLGQF